jgi:hypothetical protein
MDTLVSVAVSEPKLMLNCQVPLWYEHGNAFFARVDVCAAALITTT